jgi:hypothetical protein
MMLAAEWAGQSSEDRRATVLLRHEHEHLLDLFRRQHEPTTGPESVRDHIDADIMATLAVIDRVERDVFFPALPQEYGALVRAFEADHDSLASCAATVRRSAASVARQNVHGERLELLARQHLTAEQTLLFAAVERDHPDLNAALYNRLVEARGRLCNAVPV